MKLFYFMFLLLIVFSSFAQNKTLSLYSFENKTSTFTTISDGSTELIPNDWDDGCTPVTNIGFSFEFNGEIYTQFSVNTNGTVNLGDQIINEETNDLESTDYINLLAPLWDDLKFYNSGDNGGIYSEISGESGSQVLTIEYFQIGRYNSTGVVTFQVKLYEADNHIEFIYGDLSEATGWHEYSTISIGMNALVDTVTEFISVTPDFENGSTVSSEIGNNLIYSQLLAEFPIGTTFSFTPPQEASDYNIAVNNLISPVNNFLYDNETVVVEILNFGLEITEGLSFTLNIVDVNSATTIVDNLTEEFINYPLESLNITTFQFATEVNLSANSSYDITITANYEGDVDTNNNQLTHRVSGIVLDNTLYNNGSIVTQTGVGANGADVSEVQTNLNMWNYGYNTNTVIGYRNADEFTIPEGEAWAINGLGFYVWQTGSTTEPTINHLDFRIYDGMPNLLETDTLIDFYDINKLSGTKFSGSYRVYDTDVLNTERPIMFSVATFKNEEVIILTEGTYWLDFSAGGTEDSGPWTPFITKPDSITTGNAWHLGYGGWENWIEDGTGTAQGMPFVIYGYKHTGILRYHDIVFSVYPNPSDGILNIRTQNTGIISICNMAGVELLREECKADYKIDLTHCPSGIYLASFMSETGIATQKIIIY